MKAVFQVVFALVMVAGVLSSEVCATPVTDGADVVSLHQKDLAVIKRNSQSAEPEKAADSSCQCLKWKPTYDNMGVTCGKNAEFYFANQRTRTEEDPLDSAAFEDLYSASGEEFCSRFYETIDDNYCVNVNMGTDQGQWCFVDAACTNLNGGANLKENEKVSWKKCAKETDKMLRHYSPEELATLAEESKLDIGLIHKMAYPLHKDQLWMDVAPFWKVPVEAIDFVPDGVASSFPSPEKFQQWISHRWGQGREQMFEMFASENLKQSLQAIVDSGIPTSFNMDSDQHPPHIIVQGTKVWLVMGGLTCVAGCDVHK